MISEIPSCSFCKKQFSKDIYYHEHMAKKSPCCSASEQHMKIEIKRIADLKKSVEMKRMKDQTDYEKNKKDSEKFQKKFQTEQKRTRLSNIKMYILGLSSRKKQIYNDDGSFFLL
jgi:acetyl-CoA carboxylase beta subunit